MPPSRALEPDFFVVATADGEFSALVLCSVPISRESAAAFARSGVLVQNEGHAARPVTTGARFPMTHRWQLQPGTVTMPVLSGDRVVLLLDPRGAGWGGPRAVAWDSGEVQGRSGAAPLVFDVGDWGMRPLRRVVALAWVDPSGYARMTTLALDYHPPTLETTGFHINFGHILHDIGNVAKVVVDEAQAVVSLIPGIGTGISSAIGLAEGILHGGGPLEIAIRTAYGAIPIPPGVRHATDVVLDSILALIKGHGNITDAAIAGMRDAVPKGLPQQVFDTLVHIVHKKHPIQKTATAAASHYVTSYTQGPAAAVAQTAASQLSPAVVHALSRPRPAPPLPPST